MMAAEGRRWTAAAMEQEGQRQTVEAMVTEAQTVAAVETEGKE